jgi:hypothetical protein
VSQLASLSWCDTKEPGTSIGAEVRALAGVVLVFGVMTPLAQLGSALVWLGQRARAVRAGSLSDRGLGAGHSPLGH